MTARRRERGVGVRLSKRKGYVIDNYLFTLYLDLALLPADPRLCLFVCLFFCYCCLFFFVFVFSTSLVSLFAWF